MSLYFYSEIQLLEPINNAVPDAFKEIIDVEEMFESVVEGIVGDSISKGECRNRKLQSYTLMFSISFQLSNTSHLHRLEKTRRAAALLSVCFYLVSFRFFYNLRWFNCFFVVVCVGESIQLFN